LAEVKTHVAQLTYHADQRRRHSPADFPPEARIEAEHVLKRIVIILYTCRTRSRSSFQLTMHSWLTF